MIEQGLQANAIFNERLLASAIELIIIVIILWVVRSIIRMIFRIIKGIWHLFAGKRADPTQSNDWLTRAQAKQEIRFKNSLPPLLPQQKPAKKKRKMSWKNKEEKTWYPTGWTLNQETGLWEPPDYMK